MSPESKGGACGSGQLRDRPQGTKLGLLLFIQRLCGPRMPSQLAQPAAASTLPEASMLYSRLALQALSLSGKENIAQGLRSILLNVSPLFTGLDGISAPGAPDPVVTHAEPRSLALLTPSLKLLSTRTPSLQPEQLLICLMEH